VVSPESALHRTEVSNERSRGYVPKGEDPAGVVLDSAENSCFEDQSRDRTNPRHVLHDNGLWWRLSCRNVADRGGIAENVAPMEELNRVGSGD
jgi:hypothetical protein